MDEGSNILAEQLRHERKIKAGKKKAISPRLDILTIAVDSIIMYQMNRV